MAHAYFAKWAVGTILIVFIHTAIARYNPLRDPSICGKPECKGGDKFKYNPEVQQLYTYNIDIATLFNGTSTNESTLHVEATIKLGFISECEGILSIYDVTLSDNPNTVADGDYVTGDDYEQSNSDAFAEDISHHTLRFSFEDGTISEICPDEKEKSWVLNFKRGLLSVIQNTMKRIDLDYITIEEDVRGHCHTSYKVEGTKETSLLIEKRKDLNSCTTGSTFQSFLQSTPYNFQSVTSERDSLMKSESLCKMSIDHNIYNQITCEETHAFQPFSHNVAGAVTVLKQTLTLQSDISGVVEDLPTITKRTTLLYDQVPTPKPTSGELKASRDLIKQLCKLNANNFQAEFSDLFTRFIHTARHLSYTALSSLFGHADTICISGRKHMLDALPYVGSSAGVSVMKDIMLNNSISDDTMHDWLNNIAFISRPDEDMLEAASELLLHKGSDFTVTLTVTALTHTFCVQNKHCLSNEFVEKIVTFLEKEISKRYTRENDFDAQESMLVSLKGLANIGVLSEHFKNTLFSMVKDSTLSVALRIACVEAFRRYPCEETSRFFESIYRNQTEDAEVRIASYLQIMRCPHYLVIRTIRHSLENEEVNQVGSFVWSHLKNLLKSSVPSKVEIQSVLNDKDLSKKFSSDIRKFSHNYEGSVFFDEYNVGGSCESNVIFSPSSYVPRSLNFNLTVDLFGKSINILELTSRVEGFENYLESVFGPKGPLNAKKLHDKLPRMRWPRSNFDNKQLLSEVDKMAESNRNNFGEPKVSLGMKIFGNDLKHKTLKGKDEILKAIYSLHPIDHIKRLVSGKELNYNKAAMFMDSNYIVPTGSGFPIILNSVGTVSVNLKIFGSLNADNFLKTKALDLVGDIRPNAAVDIVGTMSVDAFYASTAIKLKTNVYTSTAVEGNVKVRGTDVISATFSLPNEKSELFGAQSELIVVKGGVEHQQSGVEGSAVEKSTCSWPVFEKTLGLKLCAHYHYPNVTRIETAPYFPLAGPSGFGLSLQKTAQSYILEYTWDKKSKNNAMTLTFDAVGTVERRLMSANMSFHPLGCDSNLALNAPGYTILTHGSLKNTKDEKYLKMTLDINNKKHFDASLSLKQAESQNGHTYFPKAYLGVNGERVAEIQGTLKWMTKKSISQCDVDLTFHTKRLTSKVFGYVSKTDGSVGVNLKLDYKFVNTKAQRAILEVLLANRSTRTLMALIGDIKVETTAYPHFNFEAALKFQRAAGRLESKLEITSGLNSRNTENDDSNRLKVLIEIKHKTTSGGYDFEIKTLALKPASDLHLGVQVLYLVRGPTSDLKALLKYSKEKQAVINVYWSHPHGTLERYEGLINVTIPHHSPMIAQLKVNERKTNNYDITLDLSWFSGHSANIRGMYQDRSTLTASNHHLKTIIKSASFADLETDAQLYQDDIEFKIQIRANQGGEDYALFYKHVMSSLLDISTQARLKYNKQIYSVTSSVNLRERKQVLLEFHLDRFRDVYVELWCDNKELHKTAGFEIKWDANRDPNQKLIVTIEFKNPELYNYGGNLIISYPGRAVNGIFNLSLKSGQFFTQTYLAWSPTDVLSFTLNTEFSNEAETVLLMNSQLVTPLEDWKKCSLHTRYNQKNNMYSLNSSINWNNNNRISAEVFRDYEKTNTNTRYEFSSSVISTVQDFPSVTLSLKHNQDVSKMDTHLNLMLNPKKAITLKSSWFINESKNMKNLTGTVSLVSSFVGYNKGLLVSKIYVTNKKYLRGVAELDLDHRKYTTSVEGYYHKFSDNMFEFNITTPNQNLKKVTGNFGFQEEKRQAIALIQYPAGAMGVEIKLNIESLQNFDVKLYAATPLEFLQMILILGKLKAEEVDFRVGWNSLLAGFTGVSHYTNVTDFEYSYQIYTPIEGYKQNGIVAKLIFKEGLDFEVSVKLAEKRVGLSLLAQPKPKILNEMGIQTQAIYNQNFGGDDSDEDYEEIENPINWNGFIEIDSIVYPTVNCSFDIDQMGNLYVLLGTVSLREGFVEFKNEFDFMDILNINNKLYVSTPYTAYKEVTFIVDLDIVIGYQIGFGLNFDYQNRSDVVSMGTSVLYIFEDGDDSILHNITFHLHSPYESVEKIDLRTYFEKDVDVYTVTTDLVTKSTDVTVNARAKLEPTKWDINGILHVTTPNIYIPETKFDFKREFSKPENKVVLNFDMKRETPSKVHLLTIWKYISLTNFKGKLLLETPIRGMEKADIETSWAFTKGEGNGKFKVDLRPINMVGNLTVQNNQLISTVQSQFGKESRLITIQGQLSDDNLIQGVVKTNDKVYQVSGSVEVFQDRWPKGAVIHIKPQDGAVPFLIQYQANRTLTNDISFNVKLSQDATFINLYANIRSDVKEECNIHLEVTTSNTRYSAFIVDSQIRNTLNVKSLALDAQTPFEHLENPHLKVQYSKLDVKRNLQVMYQTSDAVGSIEGEWSWIIMENMQIKFINNYTTPNTAESTSFEVYYINPTPSLTGLRLGGYAAINDIWNVSSDATLSVLSMQDINLKANVKLPKSNEHKVAGKFNSNKDWTNLNYLLTYSSPNSNKSYLSTGKIDYCATKLNGNVNVEFNRNRLENYFDWLHIDDVVNVHYRMRSPTYEAEDTVVVDAILNNLQMSKNVTLHVHYPESRPVMKAQVNFREFANMAGTVDLVTPFKKYEFVNTKFSAETSGMVYNRFIELSWPNNTLIIDGKRTTVLGRSALDRNTTGVIKIEIPLSTKHLARVDYEYMEEPNVCLGSASVDYNGNNVLNAKYNQQSESRAGFDKDVIHFEAENSFRPVGVTYIHGYKYGAPNGYEDIIYADSKHFEVYDLHNRTGFNVTFDVGLQSTFSGKEITITAIHSNHTVKLWSDYEVLDQQFKQHTKIELAPTVWVLYDLNILNKTEDENLGSQLMEVKLSYPGRSFTSFATYNITENELASEFSLVWDEQKRCIQAAFDWKVDSLSPLNRQQVQFQVKHPSLQKNISLLGEYESGDNKLLDLRFTADYSVDINRKLELSVLLADNSNNVASNYTYIINGKHPATKLHLNSHGDIYWKRNWYSTEHFLDYKRTYLPLQSREAFAKIDVTSKEIEFKKKSLRDLSYLWGKYIPKFPLYTANLSAIHGKDINATGEFYLNFKEKLIKLDLNVTEDGSESVHMYGAIPDARNAVFDIWRNYEDSTISDIAYYLRLNHSRLIVSSFKWRPEMKRDIQNSIRSTTVGMYNEAAENIDYWRQYIYAETVDTILDVYEDSKPSLAQLLDDLDNLSGVEEDMKKLNEYLQEAYESNEFYIRDIVDFAVKLIDELSLKSQIQWLPQIINEFWEVMGDSKEEFQKRISWVIQTLKTYYKKTLYFINGIAQGNTLEYVSDALSKLLEHYDSFMKGLHVSFIRGMEELWKQTYTMLINNWYKTLAALEPTFIKLLHYLETVVWNGSRDFLEFINLRPNEMVESPYFGKFAKLTHDMDKFYQDISGNNTLSTIYKYTSVIWTFVNERYVKVLPFSNEFSEIFAEISHEIMALRRVPYMDYIIEKCDEIYENVVWLANYFSIKTKIERYVGVVYSKLMDFSQTALETENRRRTAKTKFIFDPSEGLVYLEQKLPISWHAFNETPKFQEIPEYKAINDLQNYFTTSKTNFWNFYYDYKPYTDSSDWFPPFKAQAMLAGSKYYVTFDRTYYNFQGSCTYLLAADFTDRNFTIAMSYDATRKNNNELTLIVNHTVIKINVGEDVVKIADSTVSRLPMQVEDLFLYQEYGIVTVDSASGFVLQCNMKFDVCVLELSGWYFGKTAGLWGTMNNEPSDDLFTSSGKKVESKDIDSFARSWTLDKTCSPRIKPSMQKHNPPEGVKALCDVFFRSKVSPFVACFPRVSNAPFLSMCLDSSSEKETCTSAIAYMNLCAVENTPLRIPEACVKCNLLNGTTVPEGEFIRFEGDAVPRSTDVVFIVEAKMCNKDLKSKRNMDILIDLIHKELFEMNITDNRYSVVTFGGNGVFNLPRSIAIDGNHFADYRSIKPYFKNIPTGNGSDDIFAGIVFATKLVFRPGVSKTFILLPCSDCLESSMKLDYAILHQLLIENDITLHILMNEEFRFQKSRVNKIFFGMDGTRAFTKNDVRELKGDSDLLGQVRKPKSTLGVCMSFARDTNGSIFTAKKLEADKKNAIKRFAAVFAKRVAHSATPKKCQICECTAPNTGLSYMECFPCHYPVFASINNGFNEDEMLEVMQPMDEDEEFDYSEE
uniref:Vitellogenin domain-containing protein n=1 Tax=Photinus pyralis TaxID=7054 RepID=A0A1Y1LL77_PHOPY